MRYEGWDLVNVPNKAYCEVGDILVHSGSEGMPSTKYCLQLVKRKSLGLQSRSLVDGHTRGFWVLRKCTEPEINEFGEVCP